MIHKDSMMAIIANDLDSMALRIAALEVPELASAGDHVRKAHSALIAARLDIHQRDMERFTKIETRRDGF